MALRNILKDGDPGLLKKSRIITDFNKRLHILLDDMQETLINAGGLGIAAPQVGVLRRAVLVVEAIEPAEPDEEEDMPEAQTDNSESEPEEIEYTDEKIIELINPQIISSDGAQCGSEGCLSKPGIYGLVTRPQNVKVKAQDRYGNEFILDAADMTARAVCHEIDHLDGILFTTIAERMLTEEEMEEMRTKQYNKAEVN